MRKHNSTAALFEDSSEDSSENSSSDFCASESESSFDASHLRDKKIVTRSSSTKSCDSEDSDYAIGDRRVTKKTSNKDPTAAEQNTERKLLNCEKNDANLNQQLQELDEELERLKIEMRNNTHKRAVLTGGIKENKIQMEQYREELKGIYEEKMEICEEEIKNRSDRLKSIQEKLERLEKRGDVV